MNTINLIGNICGDLELKQTNSGKSVMQFNIAVKRPFTKDVTDFIPLVVWEQNAEFLSRYARKGSKIGVSGKLTSRKYEDKNGNKRTSFEVVCDSVTLCDSKNDAQGAGTANEGGYIPDAYKTPTEPNFEDVGEDDSLPF